MKSTREIILHTMLDRNRATIGELADAVGINPISVRHHIAKLEADGMVSSEEERHGVGRPRRVYFLTEKGMESFPSRYVQMSNRIIEQMKQSFPADKLKAFFTDMANKVVMEYTDQNHLDQMNVEERMDLLKRIFIEEGVNVEWDLSGDHYQLRGGNCPYLQIEHVHPEVCMLDHAIIANVLSLPLEKIEVTRQTDDHCTYIFHSLGQPEKKDGQ